MKHKHIPKLDHRERRVLAESEPVMVKLHGQREKQQTLRKRQDSRVFADLTSFHEQAMQNIDAGFRAKTSGLAKIMPYEFRIPGQTDAERSQWIELTYNEWTEECERQNLNLDCFLGIVVFSEGLRFAERQYSIANGSAKQILVDGLNIYCKLCGWPVV